MKKIEFIGASGVGKSFLYRSLLQSTGAKRLWKTPDEARIALAKSVGFKGCTWIGKLCLTCIRIGIFSSRHSMLASYILRGQLKDKLQKELPRYNELIALMLKSVVQEDENVEEYRKGLFIKFYMELLLNDIISIEELGDDEVVVYDDGIVHNTYGLAIDGYFDLLSKKNPDILKQILPDGVVFCTSSIEENLKRRGKRIFEGKGTCYENNLSDEELQKLAEKDSYTSQKLIKLMEGFNIPILKIDMEAPQQDNISLISDYINNLCYPDTSQ